MLFFIIGDPLQYRKIHFSFFIPYKGLFLILILGLYFLLLFIDRKFYELILLVYGLGYLFLLSKLSFLFFIFSNWFKKLEGFIGVSLFFDDSDVNFISYFLLKILTKCAYLFFGS